LLDAIAAGELHLTGLLMIGPHLTPNNHENVLQRAKFRTKRELTKLVRELNPLPEVPDRIEPLGPAPARHATSPTWEQMVTSWAPEVRELAPGERPADWANDGSESRFEDVTSEVCATDDEALPVGPVPTDLPPIAGPQHFQMQFGATEEHVQLVERAKALLARTRPGVTLGELHLEAMRLLVASLEKRRFGGGRRPPKRAKGRPSPSPTETPRRRVTLSEVDAPPHAETRQRVNSCEREEPPHTETRQRGRYIPAAVRREVLRRDDARCTYVDARGQRCKETHFLELHHLQPFARNGAHLVSNLTLRCVAHNALAAERDFGPQLMAERRRSTRHEALAAQTRVRKRGSE
jgi:5-methylcytosine-specific restriction endonuclease McrA